MNERDPPGFPSQCVWYVPQPYRRPSAATAFCCDAMTKAVTNFCNEHENPWECNYATLVYNEPLDEYGILLRDRDPEYVLIRRCPWCGATLPESQRDRWFDALEACGFEYLLGTDGKDLPDEFLSARWRTSGARKQE